jgi:hypothetical protein
MCQVYIDSLKITVSWLSRMIKPGIAPKAFMLSDFKHAMQTMEVIIDRYRDKSTPFFLNQ